MSKGMIDDQQGQWIHSSQVAPDTNVFNRVWRTTDRKRRGIFRILGKSPYEMYHPDEIEWFFPNEGDQ